ncbi:MAG: urate hydroxylase PuuD, partial [Proteobacteria bacterium]|nr:urate hydroxylase PuuD [Pseudomonadota bacterium]
MPDFLQKIGLDKLDRAIIYGLVLAVVFVLITGSIEMTRGWASFFMRWLHVLSGVMWIGLLWYFNFVQIPSMPKIPDEQKPAVSKVIAPEA